MTGLLLIANIKFVINATLTRYINQMLMENAQTAQKIVLHVSLVRMVKV
jgi:hypothetical protein